MGLWNYFQLGVYDGPLGPLVDELMLNINIIIDQDFIDTPI